MSTKTTFKRIALVAVAALGLGVLSVAPSSATVTGTTVTVTNGTAATNAADSTTAAIITVSGLVDNAADTITVGYVLKSKPSTGTDTSHLMYLDTTTSSNSLVSKTIGAYTAATKFTASESVTAAAESFGLRSATASYTGAKFMLQLDSATTTTLVAGTYTYTVIVKSYSVASYSTPTTQTADVTITVAKLASESDVVDPSKTTSYLNAGTTTSGTSDASVSVVATAATTTHATIRTALYNTTSGGTAAVESITATLTGPGLVCSAAGTCGKSITIAGSGSANDITVRADGTAGKASIVISTTTVTFPAKTVTFFAKTAKTITLAVNKPVIAVASTTDVIRATATDADGNVWGGTAYIYAASAADALVAGSETPVACTFNASKGYHECPVAGTAKGTANFKVVDASTVATAVATSASAAVRVSTGVATTAKISFDKATYAPGEKATVLVTVLDADGNALPAQTINSVFTAAPTTNVAFGASSDTFSANAVLQAATSSSSLTTAGSQQYTVYMPVFAGDITISATGSTGLASAGRVAVTATATVTNASVDAATDAANEATDAANAATDAALAAADAADAATAAAQDASDAVAALSATVAKLVASLKAQITSLTNLVIKIQKKVKA